LRQAVDELRSYADQNGVIAGLRQDGTVGPEAIADHMSALRPATPIN
jgi:hypothetical protein